MKTLTLKLGPFAVCICSASIDELQSKTKSAEARSARVSEPDKQVRAQITYKGGHDETS